VSSLGTFLNLKKSQPHSRRFRSGARKSRILSCRFRNKGRQQPDQELSWEKWHFRSPRAGYCSHFGT